MDRRLAGRVFNSLWLLVALLVIVLAVVVALGRELLPHASRYQQQINSYLSARTGLAITTQQLQGTWRGFVPGLAATELTLYAADTGSEQAIVIDHASAQIDLWRSLLALELVWRKLEARGVRVTASENATGHWSVAGLALEGEGGDGLALLRGLLADTRLIDIEQVQLELQFYSGTQARFWAPQVRVDNANGFHRTVARLAVAKGGDDTARLVFEGRGNFSDRANFVGRGFFKLDRLNVDSSLSVLAQHWFPQQMAHIGEIDTDIDLALWFDWQRGGRVEGRGTLEAAEIPLGWGEPVESLTQLTADITAWYEPGEDRGVRLQNLQAEWAGAAIAPLNLALRQRVGRHWGELTVLVDRLDLGVTHDLLRRTALLAEPVAEVLAQLEPQGQVSGLALELKLTDDQPALAVRGELHSASVSSWRAAPAARGVSGYFDVLHQRGDTWGRVELDSPAGLALHYPSVYADYMPYGAVKGRVDWRYRRDSHQVQVTSGPVAVEGEEGQGTVWLALDIPTIDDPREPEMTLMVALRNSHARFVDRYLPAVLPAALRDWLDSAVADEGAIPEAAFLWRGSLAQGNPESHTLQVYARVEGAGLDYRPGWPALSAVSATLLVDDQWVDVWADEAQMSDAAVLPTRVKLRPDKDGAQWLSVVGEVVAEAGYGLSVLRQSPVGSGLPSLAPWQLSGQATVALDLDIPLGSTAYHFMLPPGESAPQNALRQEDYRVAVELSDARLHLPNTVVDIDAVAGRVSFSLAAGLTSDQLRGRFLGQPLTASVATDKGITLIDLDSRIAATAVGSYLGPAAASVTGSTALTGQLQLPWDGSDAVLRLSSDLQGLVLALPPPFAKVAEQALPLSAQLRFDDQVLYMNATAGELLATALKFDSGVFERGTAILLGQSATLPTRPGLLIAGQLPAVEGADWQALIAGRDSTSGQALTDSRDAGESGGIEVMSRALQGLKPRLDLTIEALSLYGFKLGKTQLRGALAADDHWQLAVSSKQLSGEVILGEPRTVLRLEHLRLPAAAEPLDPQQPAGLLGNLDPRSIPALDFAAEQISLGERPLGRLAFVSTPLADGVRLEAIEGLLWGVSLPAVTTDQPLEPALLEWRVMGEQHHSHFVGTLLIDDFAAALEAWQWPKVIDSRDAAFHVSLSWPDRPTAISAAGFQGHVSIDLEQGQFYRAAGAPTNTFLRLVSLLNFDTWLRRLRFDFSDLFNQGVSFDHLRGGLVFDAGVVRFDDPIVAAMPSGRIRLLGSADMLNEQLDARLVATLPVGTNLPWVAALLGGLPAAAGVYVTGRLFRRQVDQLSSLSYRVSGSWDDPKLEIDKIFSDSTDLED